ncbi:carbonic anhydrase family protein [Myceligenerans crystallogenes]|uniref:carbonic anhydrase n=1 Tax=Myceligenerans crystallogenes TaxID=316335 RepID=A0ABN2NDH2_9MICO
MSLRPFVRHRVPRLAALSVVVVGLAGCAAGGSAPGAGDSAVPVTGETAAAPVAADEAHWSYEGQTGPAHWGELSDEYALCADGSHQSPVDLPARVPATGERVEFEVDEVEGVVEDTGHAFQLPADEGEGTSLGYDGEEYELVQMHFHTPSEHTVEKDPADIEFHFVHANERGELLVLGLLGDEGAETPALRPFVEAVDGGPEAELDLAGLLPEGSAAYVYDGSLTTPPCSEDVHWIVLEDRVTLSAEQLGTLTGAGHDHNARPAAPLGDREITGGTATFDE